MVAHPGNDQEQLEVKTAMNSIVEVVLFSLGTLAVLCLMLAPALYVLMRRRPEDDTDKSTKRAGGPGEED